MLIFLREQAKLAPLWEHSAERAFAPWMPGKKKARNSTELLKETNELPKCWEANLSRALRTLSVKWICGSTLLS